MSLSANRIGDMDSLVEWRTHPRFIHYEVSSDGRVRSKTRWVDRGGPRPARSPLQGRTLKLWNSKAGYLQATVFVDKAPRCSLVHRLVCETFHGPAPTPDHEVRHLNGDRHDNRAENLCWGTASENARDTVLHGTHPHARKTHCVRGHEFSAENTYRPKRGGRHCRECDRINHNARNHARRLAASE